MNDNKKIEVHGKLTGRIQCDVSAVERLVMPTSPYSYAVTQRLRFIDFLLVQFGHAKRSYITDYFGISTPQATNDLKKYMQLAPDNMRYSIKQKRYARTVDFERVWA